jgi:hypothetical protein
LEARLEIEPIRSPVVRQPRSTRQGQRDGVDNRRSASTDGRAL